MNKEQDNALSASAWPEALTNEKKLTHELQVHQFELKMQNEELLRLHQELESSRNHYLRLYESAPVAYLTLNEHGVIKEANPWCARLLGVDREQLLDRRFARFVTPEDSNRWTHYFIQINRRRENQTCELALSRANGGKLYANMNCLPLKLEDNSTNLLVTFTDISERKMSEEFLRIAATAFEIQEGVIVTGPDKAVLRVNQAFTRITGYSVEEIIGRQPSLLGSGLHDSDFYRAMWEAVTTQGFWQGEIWDKRKNGEVFPMWLVNTAVTDENKRITHFVGSFTDISTQKQTEKLLRDSRRYLEDEIESARDELGRYKEEASAVKTALNIVIVQQQKYLSDAKRQLNDNLRKTVSPFLDKLKRSGLNQNQTQLLEIIETNFLELATANASDPSLSAAYGQLTPVEIQVASMVRQGLSTKAIAAILSLSVETINVHRKHIRKKLALENSTNLHSYLSLLDK